MTRHFTLETSILGESPPLPPRAIFGRDELIEKILNLTKKLNSVALIGAAGVGKTSIALAVLHHDQVKQRFGDDRRFIRCDQFPASRGHLLRRLSKVIGAATKNPEDLTPLRPLLSSKPMLIILDNAEAILDPQGIDARGAYAVLEELSRFDNLCICITSRLSPTPPRFECFDVPTLSMGAALNAFYHIYGIDDRSGVVNGILEELDFHPLSITLLAAVAHQNKWDTDRLAMEWEKRRSGVSQTEHNKGLAAAIELSLASPTLQQLGHDVRALLGVVAFLPQGINENNLSRLFPTITKTTDVFNSFCALSLTCRSNGFITMLAPLRDYLSPKDPISSPLIRATKEHYFVRMSKRGKTKLMTSEEANVEHLLNIFTATYGNSDTVWEACTNFMKRLDPHEIRFSVLRLKIEGLPDVHRSKPGCLFELSKVFDRVGNWMECKRLLTHALKLYSERGSDRDMAKTLAELSNANRMVGLPKEGIRQAEEATKISERLGDTAEKAKALISLAFLLYSDGQFDTATQTASDVIALLPEKGDRFEVCESHRVIARVFRIKGKKEEANHHYQVALGIATSSNRRSQLFWVHFGLAGMSLEEGRFKKATAHIEQAKSHAVGRAYYNQGRAMHMQAKIWFKERRFDEARSEALRAADMYQKFGAVKDLEVCRALLQSIPSQGMRFPWGLRKKGSRSAASDRSGSNCEHLCSCKRYYFLRVLTLRYKLGDRIGGCCADPPRIHPSRESPAPCH